MVAEKKVDVITEAKPHTVKKFELISSYVDSWARKLLQYSKSEGIVYIDCMSNSGVYRNEEGVEIQGTALRVASILNAIMIHYPNKKAYIFFNDCIQERIYHLKNKLNEMNLVNVIISYSVDDCNNFLKKHELVKFRNMNTLMVYDPYDASIDWDAISRFLTTWGEVIINHMVSDTARGAQVAKKADTVEKYQNTYKKTIEEIMELDGDKKRLEEIIINLIREQTSSSKREHFIASFPFYTRTNGQVYNLIHCSSNIEGIKLYKKTAWKTFGNKSSLKKTHGDEMQLCLTQSAHVNTIVDESCYFVKDIAKYIYDKYHTRVRVLLDEIYYDLDRHPIFPSEGYKSEIKKELCQFYNVQITGNIAYFID